MSAFLETVVPGVMVVLNGGLNPIRDGTLDVVLGMDWLVANCATTDCARKRLDFRSHEKESFRFTGVGVISPP